MTIFYFLINIIQRKNEKQNFVDKMVYNNIFLLFIYINYFIYLIINSKKIITLIIIFITNLIQHLIILY